jgi:hypothetical protein
MPRRTRNRQKILNAKIIEQAGRCHYCYQDIGSIINYRGKEVVLTATLDHRIPFAYCQAHFKDNYVMACQICNAIKADKVFDTEDKLIEYIFEVWERRSGGLVKKVSIPKTCYNCGDRFISKRKWGKFCSTKCRNIYHLNQLQLIERRCISCNNIFQPIKSWQVYCSKNCWKEKMRRLFNTKPGVSRVDFPLRECICGCGLFKPNRAWQKYRNKDCKKRMRNQAICPNCGHQFKLKELRENG